MNRKTIFLDRDGVIVRNNIHHYIWEKDQMKFVDGIFENLKLLIQNGFELFIVSNQGGISKGIYSKSNILKLHKELESRLDEESIRIREIVFCPHHPDVEKCMCRKPESLMIDKLIAKYKIDKADSYFIGDSESDLNAAQKAGIHGIKIDANQNMYPFISNLL